MFISDICLDKKIDGNHHFGHIMLECFKKRNPDDIFQIDAATGEEETYGSVLHRVVQLARSLRGAGLRPGDVLTVSGRNHLNVRIPFYASMMCGLPLSGLGTYFEYDETRNSLAILRPKISFCDDENYEYYKRAVEELGLDTKIVTFYGGDSSMSCFMEKYYEKDTEEFRPSYFDTGKVYVWIVSTSGSTGKPKLAAVTHAAAVARVKFRMIMFDFQRRPTNIVRKKTYVELHPLLWATAYFNSVLCPLVNVQLVQSSKVTDDGFAEMFQKYKPSFLVTNPAYLSILLKGECDLTSLDFIYWGGITLHKNVLRELKAKVRKDTKILEGYGQIESGYAFYIYGNEPAGSCGTRTCLVEIKLMDPTTHTEITEPHKHGELWVRGPACFPGYYNNPEETLKTITEDGWVKTGDLFYCDENGFYYFVDRLKNIIRNVRYTEVIFVRELEEVIQSHPGVSEVCVIGVCYPKYREVPLACVVRARGSDVTAQQIKDLVADQLSEAKQLRGGVVFIDSLPKTGSGKFVRGKLQDLVMDMPRE